MIKNIICVSCPMGCPITVELSESGEVLNVTGNTCPRGKAYAITECTAPTRMLTSTVKVNGGRTAMVPVKTSKPIPKGMMFDIMKEINSVEVDSPVKIGQVIIENVLDTGADIIATNED